LDCPFQISLSCEESAIYIVSRGVADILFSMPPMEFDSLKMVMERCWDMNHLLNYSKELTLITLLISMLFIFPFSVAIASGEGSCDNDSIVETLVTAEYLDRLERELQTRAYAYLAVKSIANSTEDESEAKFWNSYLKFEGMNQVKYQYIKCKYQLETMPSVFTRLKELLGRIPYSFIPNYSLQIMKKSTVSYVSELIEMEKIAPYGDADFMAYVLMQEKMQVVALSYALEEKWEAGAQILLDFIASRS
jgi:hypothetical protein